MTSQRELSKMNIMVRIIVSEKIISQVQLVMRSGISISYYEKLKPFMEEIFSHIIIYDKPEKVWRTIKQEELDIEL